MMIEMGLWKILGAISVGGLLLFWRKNNAVWGGLTLGLIIGTVIALIFKISEGSSFSWKIIMKGVIIGILAGIIFEIMGLIGDRIKRK